MTSKVAVGDYFSWAGAPVGIGSYAVPPTDYILANYSNGLYAYYSGGALTDLSTTSVNLQVSGTCPTTTGKTGIANTAYKIMGLSNYLTYPTYFLYPKTTKYSVLLFANMLRSGISNPILKLGSLSVYSSGIQLLDSPTSNALSYDDAEGNTVSPTITNYDSLSTNWCSYAWSSSGNGIVNSSGTYYFNGSDIGTKTVDHGLMGWWRFGSSRSQLTNGSISVAGIMMWSGVSLTQSQIQDIHNNW